MDNQASILPSNVHCRIVRVVFELKGFCPIKQHVLIYKSCTGFQASDVNLQRASIEAHRTIGSKQHDFVSIFIAELQNPAITNAEYLVYVIVNTRIFASINNLKGFWICYRRKFQKLPCSSSCICVAIINQLGKFIYRCGSNVDFFTIHTQITKIFNNIVITCD